MSQSQIEKWLITDYDRPAIWYGSLCRSAMVSQRIDQNRHEREADEKTTWTGRNR
jgi:hypothetical protein